MNLDLEDNVLAGQFGGILLGEGDVDILLVAGLHADNSIFKAGNKGVRTQLQIVVLALAALETLTVQEAVKVDDSGVAQLGFALDGNQTGSTVNQRLQLALDVSVSDLDLGLGSGQALVLAQLDFGLDGNDSLKGQAFLAHGDDLHGRICHYVQTLLLDGLGVSGGIKCVHSIFIENAGAVHALDDLTGSLALAEAGDRDAALALTVSLFDGGVEFLSRNLNYQFYGAVFFFLGTFNVHVCPPFGGA